MKTKILLTGMLFGVAGISACVGATSFEPMRLHSNVAPSSVQYNKSMGERASEYFTEYSACLGDAFVAISQKRIDNGELPSLQAKIYEDACAADERAFYQAIYSASKTFDPEGPDEFAHNTAIKGVKYAKTITFEALWEGFQPPQ